MTEYRTPPAIAPHDLRRSVSFWSGILVIVFLCWAWWMSTRSEIFCQWNCFMVSNTSGGIEVNSIYSTTGFHRPVYKKASPLPHAALPAPFILRGTGSPSAPLPVRQPVSYRDDLELLMTRRDPTAWLVFIPHWLILLAVILPWAALLHWRSKRRLAAQKGFVVD